MTTSSKLERKISAITGSCASAEAPSDNSHHLRLLPTSHRTNPSVQKTKTIDACHQSLRNSNSASLNQKAETLSSTNSATELPDTNDDTNDGFTLVRGYQPRVRKESPTMTLTFADGKPSVNVCRNWATACVAPRNVKSLFKCEHERGAFGFKHLPVPICFKWSIGECDGNSGCSYIHPEEFKFDPKNPRVWPVVQAATTATTASTHNHGSTWTKPKTMMCGRQMMHVFNPANPCCTRGTSCVFAHSNEQINSVPAIAAFEQALQGNQIDLQRIYEEVTRLVTTEIGYINELLKKDDKPCVSLPPATASNFLQILAIWALAARKENAYVSEKQDHKLALFGRKGCPEEDHAFAISRLTGSSCAQDRAMTCAKLVGQYSDRAPTMSHSDACLHSGNCMRGPHHSLEKDGCVSGFCAKELRSGQCDCSLDAVLQKRTQIADQLEKLRQHRANMIANGQSAQSITQTIEKLVGQLYDTVYPRHFIKEHGCAPLHEIGAQKVFEKFVYDPRAFADLPFMTTEELAKHMQSEQNKHELFVEMSRARAALAKEEADKKAALEELQLELLWSTIDKTDPIACSWLEKSAFKFMTLEEYARDCCSTAEDHGSYNEWFENHQDQSSFDAFKKQVATELREWMSMGIIRRKIVQDGLNKKDRRKGGDNVEDRDDIWEEIECDSEKENYANFWAFFNQIPINEDLSVVGGLSAVAQAAPLLFNDYLGYRRQCPTTFTDFPTWVGEDNERAAVVALVEDGVDYFDAAAYIKMGVGLSGMSVQEFAQNDHSHVRLWMKINKERESLKTAPISLDYCIANAKSLSQFYLKGWHMLCPTFDLFVKAVADGWHHMPSGITGLASENTAAAKKAKAKNDKKAQQLEDDMAMIARLADGCSLKALGLKAPVRKVKVQIIQASETPKTPEEDEEEQEEDEFENFSTGAAAFMKPQKASLPMNTTVPLLGKHRFFVHHRKVTEERLTADVHCRSVVVGPFASEKAAVRARCAINARRIQQGLGLVPTVEKVDGVANKSEASWNVVWIDTVNVKKPALGYDWLISFIQSECKSGIFKDSDLTEFQVDISWLKDSIDAYLARPVVKATEALPLKQSVAPSSEEVAKSARLSAEDVKARLEAKKLNKQALKDAKLVKKVIVAIEPTEPVSVAAPVTNCKPKKSKKAGLQILRAGRDDEVIEVVGGDDD